MRWTFFKELSFRSRRRPDNAAAPLGDVPVDGLDGYYAAIIHDVLYLLPNTPVSRLFSVTGDRVEQIFMQLFFLTVVGYVGHTGTRDILERYVRQFEGNLDPKWFSGRDELLLAMSETTARLKVYNPLAWGSRGGRDD